MMKRIAVLIAFLVFAIMADANDGDDTLRHHIEKSTLVATGTIWSELAGISDEDGVVNWSFTFKWSDILHGEAPPEESFRVTIVQFELQKSDRSPLLKKGTSCILFLVPDPPNKGFEGAGPGFAIQPYNALMVKRIKSLSKEAKQGRTTNKSTLSSEGAPSDER
jgi:hypothetical protein